METEKTVKSVDCEIKSPGGQAGAHTWMQKDLQKSGLSIENFTIESLKGEAELRERLGFTSISGTPIATSQAFSTTLRLTLTRNLRLTLPLNPKGTPHLTETLTLK